MQAHAFAKKGGQVLLAAERTQDVRQVLVAGSDQRHEHGLLLLLLLLQVMASTEAMASGGCGCG